MIKRDCSDFKEDVKKNVLISEEAAPQQDLLSQIRMGRQLKKVERTEVKHFKFKRSNAR